MARRYKPTRTYRKRSRNARSAAQRAARNRRVARNRRAYRSRRLFKMYRNPWTLSRVHTTVKYCDVITLDPKPEALGATGSNVYQFSANGLYDVDITGTGHQPMYHDNYSLVYSRYRVNHAMIKVTVVNHAVNTAVWNGSAVNSQANYAYRLFILNDASHGVTSEYPAYMNPLTEEGGYNIKWRFVAPQLNGRLPQLRNRQTPHSISNLSPQDDTLASTVDGNPAKQTYFYIGITSADGYTDPPSVYLRVEITYKVTYFDRKNNQTEQ